MLNKIIQTIFSKGLIAVINFLIVVITAKYTGVVGRGEISLMYLNVTMVQMFNDLVGGVAIVYLSSREPFRLLFKYSFLWAVFCGLFIPFFVYLVWSQNLSQMCWFIVLSTMSNFVSFTNFFLNGNNKIKENNIGNVFQSVVLIIVLIFVIFILENNTVTSYYIALLSGFSINFLISIYFLRNEIKKSFFQNEQSNVSAGHDTFKTMFKYGITVQWGNITKLLNYRLSYYYLDILFQDSGKKMVGLYSTASSITEAVWIIMHGITMVQYAKISNTTNANYARKISVKLAKLSFLLTLIAIIILNFLPIELYLWLFGVDFYGIKQIILLLSPGIVFLSLTGIYVHYFSGLGLMSISSISALVGFFFTVVFGFLLISKYDVYGAAITANLSYFSSGIFLIIYFKIKTGVSFKAMFWGK